MSQKPFHKIFILLGVLFFWGMSANAQTPNNIDSLLCKEWKLAATEEGGKRKPVKTEFKNFRMIFGFDHKLKYYDGEMIEVGVWSYDEKNHKIILVNEQSNVRDEINVVKLTETELVTSHKEKNKTIIVYRVPAN
jgi:hypothetical protein